MTKEAALERLKAYEMTSFALGHAAGLIYWDASTYAPKGSSEVRPYTMGELSKIGYDLTTNPETAEMLETLMAVKDELDPVTARDVSELYRDYERTKKVPKDEYTEYQMLLSDAENVWHEAKETNNYTIFEPYLQKVFDTQKKFAGYYDSTKDPYDVCLDIYERGLTRERCDEFFSKLREGIVPLIHKISEAKQIDNTPLKSYYSVEDQRNLADFIIDRMYIDRKYFNIAETEHPFTTNFSKKDVRVTTHYYENDILSGVYSNMHEGGHALYELHTGEELMFTSLAGGASMAIHESQSRFYENIIGRNKAFTNILLAEFKKRFPDNFEKVSEEDFYKMVNASAPSLIRTEADELTYCLHIMVRYEIEKLMFDGKITAKDIPATWNKLYKEYLGVEVPSDREGCLQDSHWSGGSIGYFPSYALGSAYGAQYLKEMNKDFDVEKAIANNEISKINDWFEEKIWKFGLMKDPIDIFEDVCGKFDPQSYIDYLTEKFTDIYGL